MEYNLVSIITVCYNSEQTIEQTIQSVLNQTYKNIEYIIVDGGSTDHTLEIIERYRTQFGMKLVVVSEKDKGIYDAMNKGIRLSNGSVIGIINSDDYYELDAVEHVMNVVNQDGYQVIYGETREIKNGVEKSISIQSHLFLDENMISHPSSFVTKKTYEKWGKYSMRYPCVADYDFMLRMKKANVEFIPIYHVIANFRVGGISGSEKAYMDLITLQHDYQMIGTVKYWKHRVMSVWSRLKNKESVV